jgi:hypothetical protein
MARLVVMDDDEIARGLHAATGDYLDALHRSTTEAQRQAAWREVMRWVALANKSFKERADG